MAIINGTSGADTIKGTLQDQINGYGGNDKITGSSGDDVIYGSAGDDSIDGSAGNDLIYGGTGHDLIIDGGGDDVVYAGEGDDAMIAGAGNDKYEGGLGFDTLDFSGSATGITVDMHRGTVLGADTGSDTIKDIEKIIGTAGNDTFRGSAGDDVIVTGDGNNVVRGGQGSDDITLGGDDDTIVFKAWDVVDLATGTSRGVDVIHGFNSGNDSLDLRGLVSQLKGVDYKANLNEFVHLTDTQAGTMVQVNMGKGFVDVALLADLHTGGATAAAWASDSAILV
jgi:Ca2+-binding RTX toxin-like protein